MFRRATGTSQLETERVWLWGEARRYEYLGRAAYAVTIRSPEECFRRNRIAEHVLNSSEPGAQKFTSLRDLVMLWSEFDRFVLGGRAEHGEAATSSGSPAHLQAASSRDPWQGAALLSLRERERASMSGACTRTPHGFSMDIPARTDTGHRFVCDYLAC